LHPASYPVGENTVSLANMRLSCTYTYIIKHVAMRDTRAKTRQLDTVLRWQKHNMHSHAVTEGP